MPAVKLKALTQRVKGEAAVRSDGPPLVLHRIREVRLQEGVSLRTVARHLQSDMRTVRRQEQETTDLQLSQIYQWRRALDVPLYDLLSRSEEPLSRPVLERARMVRVMKTAQAILELAADLPLHRLARNLVSQLTEVMPELADVGAWHSVGQQRTLDEWGRTGEQTVSLNYFGGDFS